MFIYTGCLNKDNEKADLQEDDDLTEVDASISPPLPPTSVNDPNSSTNVVSSMPNCPNRIFRIPLPKDNKKRRQEQAEEAFHVMRDMKEAVSKQDEYSVFDELVANKLRKFANRPRTTLLIL
ncbi:hypothetical protein FQR65_LT14352 [Abscondita terminalis]|nr:hypothetical protein FQR65_LT14352 [Abscondita terminalis]